MLPDDAPTLAAGDLNYIIDVCSAFMDFTSFVPSGPAMKKAANALAARSQAPSVQDIVRKMSRL